MGKGFVNEHTASGQAAQNLWPQRAPEVIGDDNAIKSLGGQGPRIVFDVGLNGTHKGCQWSQAGQRFAIAVKRGNLATLAHQPACVAAMAAGHIESTGTARAGVGYEVAPAAHPFRWGFGAVSAQKQPQTMSARPRMNSGCAYKLKTQSETNKAAAAPSQGQARCSGLVTEFSMAQIMP